MDAFSCMNEYKMTKTCKWISQRWRWATSQLVLGNYNLVGIVSGSCVQTQSRIEPVMEEENSQQVLIRIIVAFVRTNINK